MHYDILDENRLRILPKLANWKSDYVLAGGTAFALQINHRDSVDFDFFTEKEIDTKKLFEQVKEVFSGQQVEKIQEERNTLSVLIDNEVQLSFMTYPYKLLLKPNVDKYLSIASIEDIGCMKLSAITGRSSNKDYIDLYYILQKISLQKLLELAKKKFPNFNTNLALKSLVYFDDIAEEPIRFQKGKEVSQEQIQTFLKERVKEYYNK